MFLHLLNKVQEHLFLELAIKAAEVNGIVTDEETKMIDEFAREMMIEPFYVLDSSVEDILDKIDNLSFRKVKKICLFEVLGIMFSDSEYDDEEKKFMLETIDKFNIERESV